MKTLSEIDTTSKRATRGAGFSWGIAEEVGKNMRLLELYGLPGIKNLNKFLKDYKEKQFQKITLISETNYASKNPFCPITLGTNFIDQVNLLDKKVNIQISNLAFPILFIPFVSRASEIVGKKIFLKVDDKEFLFNLNQSIYSNYLKNEILENCNNIKISFLENNNSFNEDEWKELYKLSEDTFVEETESLKIGAAGAGLTDND
jgi:hypothetical protein|tara:strand:- start:1280 stop:1891 length:612 start_codon:yes stop_codon:yes gene_type:complete